MSRPRALVADDLEGIREMLTNTLEDLGYEVVAVRNGWQAIRMATLPTTKPFSVLITDNDMGPGPKGVDVMKTLRPTHPLLPMILQTGSSGSWLYSVCRDLDAVFLAKPFGGSKLMDALRAVGAPIPAPLTATTDPE